jgi:sortase A
VRTSRRYSWLERLLVVVAVVCLGWWTTMTVHGWYFRTQQMSLFESLTRKDGNDLPPLPEPSQPRLLHASLESGGLVGVLDVPRLGISTPVISGDDEQALDVAVGHLADTPLPWEHGNSTVAAHRDGLFRPLEHVRRGDLVRMRTAHGDFDYTVRDTKIVDPDDLSVLAKGRTDSLTLITCYPFAYIGHAPQRFIVRAERVGVPAQPGLQTRPAAAVQAATAPTPVRPRATKPKPAKPAKASARSAPRQTLTRDTVSRQTRKGVSASRPAERKVDPPKKRKWYRLLF